MSTGKFSPSEAKAVDALMETFHIVKALNEDEKENIQDVIIELLKQSYPSQFLELKLEDSGSNMAYSSVV